MPLAYWSVDTKDWKTQNAEAIYKTVMNSAYDGAIILMHDIYPSTAAAMEGIVPDLIDRGYRLVTVSELLRAKNGKPPSPGEQYSDAFTINNATK
jgi:peptidoglycan/xylan/chitin deacetylase (PgdA/CDA1 family)